MKRLSFILIACLAVSCGQKREPLQVFNQVPEFTLTDQTGAEFSSAAQLKGKVWIADFIFTTCTGPCPRMTSQMRQLRDALEGTPNLRFVSFTVDPVNDTPAALTEYAKRHKADPSNWSFLTGPQELLHSLNRTTFMLGNVQGNLDHSTRFILIDQQGRVRRYYDTTEPNMISEAVRDVRELTSGGVS